MGGKLAGSVEEKTEGSEKYHFDCDESGTRIDSWLARRLPISRSKIQHLIAEGNLSIDGEVMVSTRHKTAIGGRISFSVPAVADNRPMAEEISLDVIYEDPALIAINKPPGMVVHPAPGHAEGTLVNALLAHCPRLGDISDSKRPGIVHRLDKDTSGVLIAAKTQEMEISLKRVFKSGEIERHYQALVHGAPVLDSGRIEASIGRHPIARKRMACNPPNAKPAVSRYRVLERFAGNALLQVDLETGRTHQIRLHMAHIGLPVVGDSVYGHRRKDREMALVPGRQMLHAWRLRLKHPLTGQALSLTAPLPEDMRLLIESCR